MFQFFKSIPKNINQEKILEGQKKKYLFYFFRSASCPGFSIIQVVVAIVIFGLTLSATVSLVSTVIRQVEINKQRITAIYLAQECLELTRNVRDSSWKQNYPWDCLFGDSYSEDSQFTIEATDLNYVSSGSTLDCQKDFGVDVHKIEKEKDAQLFLLYNRYRNENGKNYNDNNDAQKTLFKRILTVKNNDDNPDKLTAICTVTWNDEKIVLSEVLSNWRKK